MKRFLVIVTFLLSFKSFSGALSADLVVVNGLIRTMDDKRTVAESLAVLGGNIVAIGSNAHTKKMVGAQTKVIDAKGKLVLPGFNDAHVHMMALGLSLSNITLREAKTQEEFVQRIKTFAEKLPKGRWVQGGRWDHENWLPSNLPTARMIDEVTPHNPVFIVRVDGHMGLANSLALKLAGISRETKDPQGGVIMRDASGEPTGILKDAAMTMVEKIIPPPSSDEKLEYGEKASAHAASLGVTSVQDMSTGRDIGVFQELARQGKVHTRIYGCSPIEDLKRWENTGVHYAFGSSMLRVGCLKGFADGSLGARTAWLFDPYVDDPQTSGLAGAEFPHFATQIAAAEKARLQVFIHAIGDRANASVLDLFEKNADTYGARDRRFRIEHVQHLRQQDIPRFGKLKVIASMQPAHLMDDGRWAAKRLDDKRLKGSYAWRSLLDSGAVLAFGSDAPVVSLNPLLGIFAAVTRQTLDGKNPGGWYADEKITVDEAVRAFTFGSAYGEFQENTKGTLEIGKVADFVILSNDIFTIDPALIQKVKVLKTFVNGNLVFGLPN